MGMPTPAEKNIGEDRAFTTRALVLQIPIIQNPHIQSLFCRDWDYSLPACKHFRDDWGCAVIHPVRDLKTLRELCEATV